MFGKEWRRCNYVFSMPILRQQWKARSRQTRSRNAFTEKIKNVVVILRRYPKTCSCNCSKLARLLLISMRTECPSVANVRTVKVTKIFTCNTKNDNKRPYRLSVAFTGRWVILLMEKMLADQKMLKYQLQVNNKESCYAARIRKGMIDNYGRMWFMWVVCDLCFSFTTSFIRLCSFFLENR